MSARFAYAFVLVCLMMMACTGEESNRSVVSAAGGSIVVGLLSEPTTLNPLAATSSRERNIIDLIFLKLLKEQANFLDFEPLLAEQWTFSDDSLAITFTIREGVTWHDGRPVTAHDVAYTFELQKNPDVAWSGRHFKDRIDRVEAVDDRTAVFHFTTRYPYQLMDANDGPILPKHLMSTVAAQDMRTAEFGRMPVGNGPFRLAAWESTQFTKLERNASFYDPDLPRLDTVIFRFVPDETSLMTMLKTGEIDFVEFVSPEAVPSLEANATVAVYRYAGREMSFIAWNTSRAPFDERGLRRALALGIDASEVIHAAWNGLAEISDSPMHPILWPHDPSIEPLPYDPDAARKALAGLGWVDGDGDGVVERGGAPLEFEMVTNQTSQQNIDAITVVQAQLREIGVKVNLRVLEWSAFMQAVVREGDFDACLFSYEVATRADLKNFWATGATYNLSRYSNPEVDALIDKARATPLAADALPLWHACQRLIYEDQPHYFLALPYELAGVNTRLCNVEPNAQGPFVNLPEWYIGDDCR